MEKEPKIPPSRSQALLRNSDQGFSNAQFLKSFKSLLTNRSFLFLVATVGIVIGIINTIGTLLNQIILVHYPVKPNNILENFQKSYL